jgi:hypothetical protein
METGPTSLQVLTLLLEPRLRQELVCKSPWPAYDTAAAQVIQQLAQQRPEGRA